MHTVTPPGASSKSMRLTGQIIRGLIVLFMLFDSGVKSFLLRAALEGTARLGYPAHIVFLLGIVALLCTVLYAIPRTAILGAILLTGYFGGATATQVRVGSLSYLLPILFGVLAWAGCTCGTTSSVQ